MTKPNNDCRMAWTLRVDGKICRWVKSSRWLAENMPPNNEKGEVVCVRLVPEALWRKMKRAEQKLEELQGG